MLIYIHGFNSSALSYKAGLVRKRMVELRRGNEFACPELPGRPMEAVALLERMIEEAPRAQVALAGSSLGGYYATWLAERHALRAVLLNPAVRPYELLKHAIGRQTNLYTGAQYDFTEQHVAELRALEVESIAPERYLLFVQSGDEVLDYRDAVDKYRGCEQVIDEGGDHGFADFDRHVDRALAFCGVVAT
jgi:predicted esterase YcpF (UPF0227 family)